MTKKNVIVHRRSNFPSHTHPKQKKKKYAQNFHFYTCQN